MTSAGPDPGDESPDLVPAALGDYLVDLVFPATQDDLLAGLVHHRAPSRILAGVAQLPRTQRFTSLDDVRAQLRGLHPGSPTSPLT